MIYNSGTKIIQVGSINKISDQNQTVFQYIKADSPTPPHDYSQDYLTFEALESGTFRFSGNSVNYSLDSGATWTSLASDTDSPTVNAGDKIMFKATLTPASSKGVGRFYSTGAFNAMGNPYSLLDEASFSGMTDLTGYNYALYNLFASMTGLTSAENLSLAATALTSSCYFGMFQNCSSLTTAPMLPATTLADGCYDSMFSNCTSLTTAPELQATTLADSCYANMFSGCRALTVAPDLSATTLGIQSYAQMFQYCSGLVNPPVISATTLASHCCIGMFNGCSSLTEAPDLLATTLTTWCYRYMFSGCTSLNYIKMLATDISADRCIDRWTEGVAASGTFVKNASMTTLPTGDSGIPSGWTVQDNV